MLNEGVLKYSFVQVGEETICPGIWLLYSRFGNFADWVGWWPIFASRWQIWDSNDASVPWVAGRAVQQDG